MDSKGTMGGIILAIVIIIIFVASVAGSCDNSSSKYEYDRNDKYYRNNDYNDDGKINDYEFQNAVDDWMDDHGY